MTLLPQVSTHHNSPRTYHILLQNRKNTGYAHPFRCKSVNFSNLLDHHAVAMKVPNSIKITHDWDARLRDEKTFRAQQIWPYFVTLVLACQHSVCQHLACPNSAKFHSCTANCLVLGMAMCYGFGLSPFVSLL